MFSSNDFSTEPQYAFQKRSLFYHNGYPEFLTIFLDGTFTVNCNRFGLEISVALNNVASASLQLGLTFKHKTL